MDFEKNRAEHVTHLELLVQNLQLQLQDLKADERWVPKLGSELVGTEGMARLTLSFGGKRQTSTFTYEFLQDHSVSDATTNILELGFKDFVLAQLRPMLEPEVDRLKKGALVTVGAGKW